MQSLQASAAALSLHPTPYALPPIVFARSCYPDLNHARKTIQCDHADDRPMTDALKSVLARWVRLGAMFDSEASRRTPDIEVLLLDTAMVMPQFSRVHAKAPRGRNIFHL